MFDCGNHAGEFFGFTDGDGTGTRAFAANVDDCCTGLDEVADGGSKG